MIVSVRSIHVLVLLINSNLAGLFFFLGFLYQFEGLLKE